MAAGRVLATQFQKFIKSWLSLDDEDGIMTRKRVTEKQMKTKEGKVDMTKALNASLVDTKSNSTNRWQYTCSISGIGLPCMSDDAYIPGNPYLMKSQMAEVQLTSD
ncbi:hypothetical protein Tco_0168753 [Tanacetum coccineum]